jgi:hypothetical protein
MGVSVLDFELFGFLPLELDAGSWLLAIGNAEL